jgi:predicted MFS family arabinose efflux permease
MPDVQPIALEATQDTLPLGLLATAGFLSMSGARVMDPLLAVVAADFGVGVPTASIVIAAFTLPYGLNQLLLGPLGDRFGKLRVMLAALLGFVLFTGLCATARNLPMLVVLRALAGAASAGLIPLSMAYIGDAVPYERRQITISRYMTGNVMGLILAGPIGGVLGEWIGWRGVFLVLAGAAGVVAALLARRLQDLPDRRAGTPFSAANYLALALRPTARLLLLATAAEGAMTVGAFPFLAPFLHADFGLSYGVVGLILACFGIGSFLYTRLAPILLPRLGEPGMILLGGGVMALCLLLATITRSGFSFIVLEMGLGLGFYLLHGVLQARATELLPHARSTAVASFAFMLFLGQSVGALSLAAWIAAAGYRPALAAEAIMVLVVAIWLRRIVSDRTTD